MRSENHEAEKVGSRGTLFTFGDLGGLTTTAYLIEGPRHWFVVDTFLGPESMATVLEHIGRTDPGKPVVVFNTHYHWDHVWGNCAFHGATIAAHDLTRSKMAEVGQKELEAYGEYRRGKVSIVLPQLLFDSKLRFEEDGVELFHSPGHTEDSSSCYDRVDGVLLAGDNLELPLPYLNWGKLDRYLETLEDYLKLEAGRVIAGHHPRVTGEIINGNMEYLRDFASGRAEKYLKGEGRDTHTQNQTVMERQGWKA